MLIPSTERSFKSRIISKIFKIYLLNKNLIRLILGLIKEHLHPLLVKQPLIDKNSVLFSNITHKQFMIGMNKMNQN
jgi:hypothetical protein